MSDGQLVDLHEPARHLVGREAVAGEVAQRRLVEVGALAQHHRGDDLARPSAVGQADDRGVLDVGVGEQRLFDLAWARR